MIGNGEFAIEKLRARELPGLGREHKFTLLTSDNNKQGLARFQKPKVRSIQFSHLLIMFQVLDPTGEECRFAGQRRHVLRLARVESGVWSQQNADYNKYSEVWRTCRCVAY